jgi:hypothetical protein
MKTMKKMMAMAIATGISVFSFAQLNLGLQSATQAALNTAISTTAVTNATNAATQATRNTANTAITKTAEIKTATVKEVKANNNVNAGASASSQTHTQAGNSSGSGLSVTSSANAGADVSVNGVAVIDKTENSVSATTANLEKKASGAIETAKAVKTKAGSEVRSDSKAVKETVVAATPEASANMSSETKAKAAVNK